MSLEGVLQLGHSFLLKFNIDGVEVLRMTENTVNENKRLLTVKEFCDYLGIGQTKARELLRGYNGFGVQIGNRWYANKRKLDEWIDRQSV